MMTAQSSQKSWAMVERFLSVSKASFMVFALKPLRTFWFSTSQVPHVKSSNSAGRHNCHLLRCQQTVCGQLSRDQGRTYQQAAEALQTLCNTVHVFMHQLGVARKTSAQKPPSSMCFSTHATAANNRQKLCTAEWLYSTKRLL